ncbi:MAG TPA: O-antigen ligase family protein [Candidatus Acidoferrales bacterium]|nr:O-antigen ligase family protein [Candidatus Acidoferrales bacterium]
MPIFYLLIWILPLVNHPIWGRHIGPLSIYEYLGVVCVLYAIAHVLASRKFLPVFRTWMVRFAFVLYLIAFVSALTIGQGIGLEDSSFIIYTSSMFLVFIATSIVDSLKRLTWTVLALIGSYAFASLYLIREWQVGHRIFNYFRPGWIVGDNNIFSTAAIFAIALAFVFMQGKRPRWIRLYCAGCLVISVVGVILCASRGAFLGLIAASIVLVWQTKNRIRNLALIVFLILPLSVLAPVSPLHRFLAPVASDTDSEQFHKQAWLAGLKMIETHPLFGVGLGNFKPMMPQYAPAGTNIDSVAHNMFIEVAAELGLPAFLLFVGIFYSGYRSLARVRKKASAPELVRDAALAFRAGLIGFALAGCFVSMEYEKTTWLAFGLIACLSPLARSRAQTPGTPIEAPPFDESREIPFEVLHS